ncbi:MAG TPA: UbiA family prenyltransferase [Gaiellaceae bacterium]|nr:UbiA family prenyltransferase [Gaiellaceae bacterium]
MIEASVRARPRAAVLELLAQALRVRQWTKNLLLFAGLLFAARLGDATRWADAAVAFAAYCAASSAAYLVNDVRDAESDRLHPVKRFRPVAAGQLSKRAALVLAASLGALALGASAALGVDPLLFLASFAALQLAYSLWLKQVVGLDVLAIAALFTIRAAAGADAVRVRISPWLLVCTGLLALLLALGKRRGELASGRVGRAVLARYSLGVLDRLLAALAFGTVGAYSAYAIEARNSPEMTFTIPFVVAGIGRYLLLVRRRGLGEEPEEILLADVPILAAIAGWTVTAALVLTLS